MTEKKLARHKFVTSVLLIIVAFIAGIIVGNLVYSEQTKELNRFIKQNELNSESFLIEQSMIETFDEDSCEFAAVRTKQIYEDLYSIGRQLTRENAEDELGPIQYRYLNRQYHLMQIKNYLTYYKLKKDCNEKTHIVLYYYGSNDDSTEQGHVLDEIVKKYNVKVFAIEYNYSKELQFLQEYYGIEKAPSTVIDYDTTIHGFAPYARIADIVADAAAKNEEQQ